MKKAIEFKTTSAKIRMETLEVNEYGNTRKVQIYVEHNESGKGVVIHLDDKELLNFKILLGAL